MIAGSVRGSRPTSEKYFLVGMHCLPFSRAVFGEVRRPVQVGSVLADRGVNVPHLVSFAGLFFRGGLGFFFASFLSFLVGGIIKARPAARQGVRVAAFVLRLF